MDRQSSRDKRERKREQRKTTRGNKKSDWVSVHHQGRVGLSAGMRLDDKGQGRSRTMTEGTAMEELTEGSYL